ncbi:MAG: site-specific integrase [Actinomycetota bacterium]|nr:site-specific integrase [Actinomycetota bacterium]
MARKRGNGEGSITKRKDGLYMARFTVETATGSKRKTVYAKTRKEASKKMTDAMAEASKGIMADGGPKTVGAFLTAWLENTVRGSVRKSTYDRNESLCRVHLISALGTKKLKTLKAQDVAGFYRHKLDQGCSPASVRKMHETLHKALKQAVRWGYITRNPADDVDPPRAHTEEVAPLARDEARRLLHAASEAADPLEALYVVALHTGLRQGELLALRWEDVDLEARTLQVRRTVTKDGGKLGIGPTKTAKGRRTVKLTRDATRALRDHLTQQLEEIDRLGDYFQDNGLVFCTGKGTLINPTNLRKRSFAPLLVRAGLPHMTFHQLRHTAATILLLKNVNPKIVSEMLGHASIAITLDTYSHVLPNMQDSAVEAMEEAFS